MHVYLIFIISLFLSFYYFFIFYKCLTTYLYLPMSTDLPTYVNLPSSIYLSLPIPKFQYIITADPGAGIGIVVLHNELQDSWCLVFFNYYGLNEHNQSPEKIRLNEEEAQD